MGEWKEEGTGRKTDGIDKYRADKVSENFNVDEKRIEEERTRARERKSVKDR